MNCGTSWKRDWNFCIEFLTEQIIFLTDGQLLMDEMKISILFIIMYNFNCIVILYVVFILIFNEFEMHMIVNLKIIIITINIIIDALYIKL